VTASEMAQFLGRSGYLTVAGTRLRFRVKVTDVRVRFGQIDYYVTPLAGDGETVRRGMIRRTSPLTR
jgi:hypothetical protein